MVSETFFCYSLSRTTAKGQPENVPKSFLSASGLSEQEDGVSSNNERGRS